ncbi:MAG: FG-GAP-like repeat-containing protein [Bryobacteraceae bacterium]|nr:FG-GAP-like repeat-containing protein [Bryobacteraceae bacterium]
MLARISLTSLTLFLSAAFAVPVTGVPVRGEPKGLSGRYVFGTLDGSSHVVVFDTATMMPTLSFFAYAPMFTGGVNVATGDVNGDGLDEIVTGAGAGGGSHVKVFDGTTGAELSSFFAYPPSFLGGVNVAVGDVDNDGFDDIVTGTASDTSHIKVFSGQTGTEIRSFFAFTPTFTGGVNVASGDLNGDGFAEIVVGAGAGGGPQVRVFSGQTGAELASFFAYNTSFAGGVRVAAGDITGDGVADIVTAANEGGGPHVKAFDLKGSELTSFFAGGPSDLVGGVFVGSVGVGGANGATIYGTPGFAPAFTVTPFGGAYLGGVSGAALGPAAVPEPGTWALAAMALTLVAGWRRARSKAR